MKYRCTPSMSKKIEYALYSHNITSQDLAEKIGTSPSTISRIITRKSVTITKDLTEKIENALNISLISEEEKRDYMRQKRPPFSYDEQQVAVNTICNDTQALQVPVTTYMDVIEHYVEINKKLLSELKKVQNENMELRRQLQSKE